MLLLLVKLKKLLLIASTLAAVVAPISLLTIYFSGNSHLLKVTGQQRDSRDFEQLPFDSYDATLACNQEARGKFGDRLLRTNVDWHSTRFQKDRNIFMVVLQADVGTLIDFEPATVYCYISPRDYKVSYFKAYDTESRDMLSNHGFNFKDIMGFF